jgi:hypothetical protein
MHYYDEICLANVYLEDSYVLAIEEGASTLSFTMDLVLLETHPLYEKPKAGEQYCYRRARILFRETQLILWHKRSALVFTDADDNVDLGNIDTFTIEGRTYHLTGDWGAVSVRCGTLLVDLDAPVTK